MKNLLKPFAISVALILFGLIIVVYADVANTLLAGSDGQYTQSIDESSRVQAIGESTPFH